MACGLGAGQTVAAHPEKVLVNLEASGGLSYILIQGFDPSEIFYIPVPKGSRRVERDIPVYGFNGVCDAAHRDVITYMQWESPDGAIVAEVPQYRFIGECDQSPQLS